LKDAEPLFVLHFMLICHEEGLQFGWPGTLNFRGHGVVRDTLGASLLSFQVQVVTEHVVDRLIPAQKKDGLIPGPARRKEKLITPTHPPLPASDY
jgi:hypothetical protein